MTMTETKIKLGAAIARIRRVRDDDDDDDVNVGDVESAIPQHMLFFRPNKHGQTINLISCECN